MPTLSPHLASSSLLAQANHGQGANAAPSSSALSTVVQSSYQAPWWLPNAHLQTIAPLYLPPPAAMSWQRERIDTHDGDFLDIDWLIAPQLSAAALNAMPLLVLFHGMEGDSSSHYVRVLAQHCQQLGWRLAVPIARGCSGELNRHARSYMAADDQALDELMRYFLARNNGRRFAAVGVSLGGNALAHWTGQRGSLARQYLLAAVTVCAPFDLAACGNHLSRGFNLLYSNYFLRSMKKRAEANWLRFGRQKNIFSLSAMRRAHSLRAFDDAVTAPLNGFADAQNYWQQCAARPLLSRVALPLLAINSLNDPFYPAHALPNPGELSPWVISERPPTGGHVGFIRGAFPGDRHWLAQRIMQFLTFEASIFNDFLLPEKVHPHHEQPTPQNPSPNQFSAGHHGHPRGYRYRLAADKRRRGKTRLD